MPNPRELDTRKSGDALRGPQKTTTAITEGALLAIGPAADNAPSGRSDALPSAIGPSLTTKALAFVVGSATTEFAAAVPLDLHPDPTVQRTAAGGAAVHLHQSHRGIPVFQMGHTVRFTPDGQPLDAPGQTEVIDPGTDTAPTLGAAAAVRKAAEHLARNGNDTVESDEFGQVGQLPTIDIGNFEPQVVSGFSLLSRPTVFEKGPFENAIPAHLVMFIQPERTRLAWHIVLTFPDYTDQYVVIVAADDTDGEILYASSTLHQVTARGRVYEFNPGTADRRLIEFPRPISEYPVMPSTPLVGFPGAWVAVDRAEGNATHATLGVTTQTISGVAQDGSVVFDPQDEVGDDQKILNIFYFCNYMHDFLFVLGFDEAAGNFQQTNFSNAGLGGDFVRARAHSGPVYGTANMSTGPDGLPPVMNMGLVRGPNRHTAFDADVVFHEFTHGLTTRLVGGPLDTGSLDSRQSAGMGEGWSDFFALTIQNFFRAAEKCVLGDWVVNRAGGIRRAPYDDNYPHGFADLRASTDPHDIGEVWCAALMMVTRRIVMALGSKESGYRLTWQIVVDGLKLTPANPTFLQARDAILLALKQLADVGRIEPTAYAVVRRAAWESFAHFGMGVNARSADPGDVANIVADATLPADI